MTGAPTVWTTAYQSTAGTGGTETVPDLTLSGRHFRFKSETRKIDLQLTCAGPGSAENGALRATVGRQLLPATSGIAQISRIHACIPLSPTKRFFCRRG